MYIKTSQILINKEIQETILDNWSQRVKSNDFESMDTLDEVDRIETALHVKFYGRKKSKFVKINCKIEMKDVQEGIVLTIRANMLKLMLKSLFIGAGLYLVFLRFTFPFIFFLPGAILFGVAVFYWYYRKVSKKCREYLIRLKEGYL